MIHLFYLVGWGNRLGTITRWMWSLFARNRREQLISVSSLVSDTAGQENLERTLEDADAG